MRSDLASVLFEFFRTPVSCRRFGVGRLT